MISTAELQKHGVANVENEQRRLFCLRLARALKHTDASQLESLCDTEREVDLLQELQEFVCCLACLVHILECFHECSLEEVVSILEDSITTIGRHLLHDNVQGTPEGNALVGYPRGRKLKDDSIKLLADLKATHSFKQELVPKSNFLKGCTSRIVDSNPVDYNAILEAISTHTTAMQKLQA